MPWELMQAKIIDGLCQRYSCLPSALLLEPADLILPMQAILAEAEEEKSGE